MLKRGVSKERFGGDDKHALQDALSETPCTRRNNSGKVVLYRTQMSSAVEGFSCTCSSGYSSDT